MSLYCITPWGNGWAVLPWPGPWGRAELAEFAPPSWQARHRLLQWGWQRWRRRCLQSWVAERFLEAADRRLLERVRAAGLRMNRIRFDHILTRSRLSGHFGNGESQG